MSKWVISLLFALGVVTVISAVWIFRDDNSPPNTVTVARGTIDVTVNTTGVVVADPLTLIQSRVSGFVNQTGAKPGDEVSAGDILIQLEQFPFERQLDTANRSLTEAEYLLQAAELRVSESPDDVDNQFEVTAAQLRHDAALDAVEDAELQLTWSTILAPKDGIVLELDAEPGTAVSVGQLVASTYSPGMVQLKAELNELDLPNVLPGANASIRLDAYPAEQIPGIVRETSPSADTTGGVTLFTATISFLVPDDLDVRPGMNADVVVTTERRDNVLVVPERAVKTVGDRTFVTVVSDDQEDEREIIVGYRGTGTVEVVSGLIDGDIIRIQSSN